MKGIYRILNVINGYCYIGSAVNLRQRWVNHRSDLRHGKHANTYLQNAWNLYGEAVFRFEILEHVADSGQLIEREQHYMDSLQPEYNLAPLAGSQLGMVRSEETRQRMRTAHTGKAHTEETKRKLSEAKKGRRMPVRSKEHCRKISEALMCWGQTAEAKQKRSEAAKGRVLSAGHRRKLGEALRGEKNGNAKLTEAQVREIKFTETTLTQREVAARFGVSVRTVSAIKSGHRWAHVTPAS